MGRERLGRGRDRNWRGAKLRARATLTRVPTDVVSVDFSGSGVASNPTGPTVRSQCAVAMRDVRESGLTGVAVRVCFEQDCLKAASTIGSTTHSALRQTVDISLMTR